MLLRRSHQSLPEDLPSVHSVYFYDHDSALVERLTGIVDAGLGAGNAVVIVATEDHRRDLMNNLMRRGVDAKARVRDGRLNMLDAQATLDGFMANSRPDRKRFDRSMGKLLTDAKQSARNGNYGLTVFGEMVALLWAQGNKQGALELEALWNDVLSERTLYLHCAYPRRAFSNEDESRLHDLCHSHSHVIGAPAPMQ